MSNKKNNLGDLLEQVLAEAIALIEGTEDEDADRIEKTFTDRSPDEQKYMKGFLNHNASAEATVEFMKCIDGAIDSARFYELMAGCEKLPVYDLLNIIFDAFTEIDGKPFRIYVTER